MLIRGSLFVQCGDATRANKLTALLLRLNRGSYEYAAHLMQTARDGEVPSVKLELARLVELPATIDAKLGMSPIGDSI